MGQRLVDAQLVGAVPLESQMHIALVGHRRHHPGRTFYYS